MSCGAACLPLNCVNWPEHVGFGTSQLAAVVAVTGWLSAVVQNVGVFHLQAR